VKRFTERYSVTVEFKMLEKNYAISFFKGVLRTRFEFLELKIGSLESDKIIKGNT